MSAIVLVHRLSCCSGIVAFHCDEGWTVCIVEQVDTLDDSSEDLPVSLVKHGLVDGRKASMIILAHLVDVNRSFWL